MSDNKHLILLRGLPGSGKTTVANAIPGGWPVAADTYFELLAEETDSTYEQVWDGRLLGDAHKFCQAQVSLWMTQRLSPVVVHNTFTTAREIQPYLQLAEDHDYMVHVLAVEATHDNYSIHNIPTGTLRNMIDRWEILDRHLKTR